MFLYCEHINYTTTQLKFTKCNQELTLVEVKGFDKGKKILADIKNQLKIIGAILAQLILYKKEKHRFVAVFLVLWAMTDSNRRPSACKADALNQLS